MTDTAPAFAMETLLDSFQEFDRSYVSASEGFTDELKTCSAAEGSSYAALPTSLTPIRSDAECQQGSPMLGTTLHQIIDEWDLKDMLGSSNEDKAIPAASNANAGGANDNTMSVPPLLSFTQRQRSSSADGEERSKAEALLGELGLNLNGDDDTKVGAPLLDFSRPLEALAQDDVSPPALLGFSFGAEAATELPSGSTSTKSSAKESSSSKGFSGTSSSLFGTALGDAASPFAASPFAEMDSVSFERAFSDTTFATPLSTALPQQRHVDPIAEAVAVHDMQPAAVPPLVSGPKTDGMGMVDFNTMLSRGFASPLPAVEEQTNTAAMMWSEALNAATPQAPQAAPLDFGMQTPDRYTPPLLQAAGIGSPFDGKAGELTVGCGQLLRLPNGQQGIPAGAQAVFYPLAQPQQQAPQQQAPQVQQPVMQQRPLSQNSMSSLGGMSQGSNNSNGMLRAEFYDAKDEIRRKLAAAHHVKQHAARAQMAAMMAQRRQQRVDQRFGNQGHMGGQGMQGGQRDMHHNHSHNHNHNHNHNHSHNGNQMGGMNGNQVPTACQDMSVPEIDLSRVDPELYKVKLCRNMNKTGSCPYGPRCIFAHSLKEVRSRETNLDVLKRLYEACKPTVNPLKYKVHSCKKFEDLGFCPYEPHCVFAHGKAEERTVQDNLQAIHRIQYICQVTSVPFLSNPKHVMG